MEENMSKPIIHQRLPIDEMGDIIVRHELASEFHKKIKELLGDEYIVITSPFETKCITREEFIITIDGKKYSHDQLMEVVEKASMYDGLCD